MVLDELNFQQQLAVEHAFGPILVLAGAGSGKTRVITNRLAVLLKRAIPPYRILAVTFTNKAAQELKHRTKRILGDDAFEHTLPWVGTFHSICAKLIRRYADDFGVSKDFTIFDDDDQKTVCKQVFKDLRIPDKIQINAVLHAIDQAKNHVILPEEYAQKSDNYFTDIVAKVYVEYQKKLTSCGALDFGDLLLTPLIGIKNNEALKQKLQNMFSSVLVDEFQDVNPAQYQLVCEFAKQTNELMVVGDDDQAIYGFRGADVKNLLAFEQDWPSARIIKLEQNYRSTEVILQAANAVIDRNYKRHKKRLFTSHKGGDLISYHGAFNERGEAAHVVSFLGNLQKADNVSLSDCAILYRTNAQSRVLEEALRNANIPYKIFGGMRFYERAEIRDILAYLRFCHNPNDEVALRRIINVPGRGIGDATIQKLFEKASHEQQSLWTIIQKIVKSDDKDWKSIVKKITPFVELMDDLIQKSIQLKISDFAKALVQKIGYWEYVQTLPLIEAESKKENLQELLKSIEDALLDARKRQANLTLAEYLENVSLSSAADQESTGVALMTIHASKGLEFDNVFLVGLEEGLFPSSKADRWGTAGHDPMDEERRLAYVAITRAKKRLFLSYAKQRRLFGEEPRINAPSRFLNEIPKECLNRYIEKETNYVSSGSFQKRSWSFPDEENFSQKSGWRPPVRAAGFLDNKEVDPITHTKIVYDSDDDIPRKFSLGQLVYHEKFGRGEIRGISGLGAQQKVLILFDDVGIKTVLSRFVSLVDRD